MVQTDISQITRECNEWRSALRSRREELSSYKTKLQQIVNPSLPKDQLTEVEHYQNQFHIQLINIHDLKQSVKAHDRRVQYESVAGKGQITDATIADHEKLYNDFQALENTLNGLLNDFSDFAERSE